MISRATNTVIAVLVVLSWLVAMHAREHSRHSAVLWIAFVVHLGLATTGLVRGIRHEASVLCIVCISFALSLLYFMFVAPV